MANIGLDFGTTYSVISRVKEQQGHIAVEAYPLCEGGARAEVQDSLVLKNRDGELSFGSSARNKVGRNGTVTYTGFKMMLAEKNQEILKQRHYDEELTPRRIVSEYVCDLLGQYATSSGEDIIDKLVVGVPEIWFTSTDALDCRMVLKDIIQRSGYVREVELVSEPAAACAYFVHNYFEKTGRKYEGKILIVDYGGGTLDIALCDVKNNYDGKSSEVKVIARAGAGWNTEGTIGKAGMAFMEEIVKIALRESGLQENEIVIDQKFFRSVHDIELQLIKRIEAIKRTFRLNRFSEPENIMGEFDSIEYRDEEYAVTYGMLAQAYNKIIRSLLDEKLKEIIKYMNRNGINYQGGRQDDFKIALIGGFCNFYLTEKQIKEKFGILSEDRRYKDIIADRRDCEKAISYGAALIANGVIEFKQVAPYSLGLNSRSENENGPWFAIKKGEDIEFNKVKMIVGEDGKAVLFYGGSIPLIAFNFSEDPVRITSKEPLPEYRQKLRLEQGKYYKFGYSLDQSMVITLHKWAVPDMNKQDVVEEEDTVVLNELTKMLGDLFVAGGV